MDKQEIERQKAAFNDLCEQAHAALDNLAQVGADYKAELAAQYGVDPEQIQLFVTNRETELEAVIRPNKNYPR